MVVSRDCFAYFSHLKRGREHFSSSLLNRVVVVLVDTVLSLLLRSMLFLVVYIGDALLLIVISLVSAYASLVSRLLLIYYLSITLVVASEALDFYYRHLK